MKFNMLLATATCLLSFTRFKKTKLTISILTIIYFCLSVVGFISVKKIKKRYFSKNSSFFLNQRPWVKQHTPQYNVIPKNKICVCMMWTEDISSFAELSTKINEKYSEMHGYSFKFFKGRKSERDPRWDKVKVVKSLLNEKTNDKENRYDYIFWIDADAYFNIEEKDLEEFVYKNYDLVICDDPMTTGVNTGTFLIRNTDWSKFLVDMWWANGEGSHLEHDEFHEQDTLDLMYKADFLGLKKKMLILPAQCFNSNHFVTRSFEKGWNKTFIVHLMGEKKAKRSHVMKKKMFELEKIF